MCLYFFICITASHAMESQVMVTNVTGTQFTISWVTENNCIGKIMLYDHRLFFIETFTDDRDKKFNGDTHHVSISGLSCNTDYAFSVISGDQEDNNNGQFYTVSTGKNIIPTGSFQPAGQIFLKDKKTAAANAIVYIVISNDEKQSAPLSTIVDQNGYWYTELVNARTKDNLHLFNISTSSVLSVLIEAGKRGTASMELMAKDNNGGKSLYEPFFLR